MSRLLSRIFGHKAGTKRRSLHKKSALQIESLEDRSVPATFLVNTFADVVANDGLLSLREAVSRANALPGPDTIRLQAGTYRIRLAGLDNNNDGGDFDVTDSLTIAGAGRAATVIEGKPNEQDSPSDGIFDALGPINLAFAKLTLRQGGNSSGRSGGAVHAQAAKIALTNCLVTGNFSTAIGAESGNVTLRNTTMTNNVGGEGGAIFAGSGNVVLVDSTVSGNSAQKGGGIFALRGTTTLSRSTVSLNRAAVDGGGIAAEAGTVILTNGSSVRRNVAGLLIPGASNGRGGGVFAASVNVTRSTVSGNVGTIGGGLFTTTANLTDSAVSGNTSQREGRGILAATVKLTRSTVSGNTAAGAGGGIRATTANLANSTVSGNTAVGQGAGVFAAHGTFLNSTIVENMVFGDSNFLALGVGVARGFGTDDPIRVKNTIIANNFSLGGGNDVFGFFISEGNNLIGVVGGDSAGFGVAGDQLGNSVDPLDPMLGDLAFNVGTTKTHAPLPGSPVIDRGNNSGAPATDQRGVARPRDGDGNGSRLVDIGAFER
jgi:hypothetical protein